MGPGTEISTVGACIYERGATSRVSVTGDLPLCNSQLHATETHTLGGDRVAGAVYIVYIHTYIYTPTRSGPATPDIRARDHTTRDPHPHTQYTCTCQHPHTQNTHTPRSDSPRGTAPHSSAPACMHRNTRTTHARGPRH